MDEITIEEIYRNITNIIEKIDIIESKIDSIYEVSIIIMDNVYNVFKKFFFTELNYCRRRRPNYCARCRGSRRGRNGITIPFKSI